MSGSPASFDIWTRTHRIASIHVSPFFDKVIIDLPGAPKPLVVASVGAPTKPYIKSVTVNGKRLDAPILAHSDIAAGGLVAFEMSETPQTWGSSTLAELEF